jgi:outer membrane protein insertion porin family
LQTWNAADERNSSRRSGPRGRTARRRFVAGAGLLLRGVLAVGGARADEELDFGLETARLRGIEFRGNETFSGNELKAVLRFQEGSWTRPLYRAQYEPDLINTQLRLLETFYRNRGFHQVRAELDSIGHVRGTGYPGDILHIGITEGPRTYIRHVQFEGNGPVSEQKLREVIRLVEGEPAPADRNAYGRDIYAMLRVYRDETYFAAEVTPEVAVVPYEDESGYGAEVLYRIEPGLARTVADITLTGNDKTHDNVILRELRIRPGDPLRWSLVEQSRRNLLNTTLFRDVAMVPTLVDSTTGATDLEVRVIERRAGFFEIGLGVGSLERVRGQIAWGNHNWRGTARRFELRGRASWNLEDIIDYSPAFKDGEWNFRGDARYVNPRLWDSRYSFDVELYAKNETRGESGLIMFAYGANVGTSWQASRRVRNRAYVGYKVTNPAVHPLAPQDLKDRFNEIDPGDDHVRSLNWATFVDHRNDIFRPESGMYTVGTLQLAGGPLGGDYSFFKWTASWHNYQRVPVGGVLALRLKVGGTRPYGSSLERGPDGVPYDDRFFAGGASTVRGYGHNSLGPQVTDPDELDDLNFSSDVLLPDNPARGGNYLLLTNLEWRFPLPILRRWQLASVLFFEGGNVWEQISDVRMRGFRLTSDPGDPTDPGSTKVWDYRYSYGTGVRLDTPVGPVRVDVGFPLKRVNYVSDTRNYQDPKVVWHFSLGYPF